jgi:hypothetical protein
MKQHLYYMVFNRDSGCVRPCWHQHETIPSAIGCLVSAGDYLVAVEYGAMRELTPVEEAAFQTVVYGKLLEPFKKTIPFAKWDLLPTAVRILLLPAVAFFVFSATLCALLFGPLTIIGVALCGAGVNSIGPNFSKTQNFIADLYPMLFRRSTWVQSSKSVVGDTLFCR